MFSVSLSNKKSLSEIRRTSYYVGNPPGMVEELKKTTRKADPAAIERLFESFQRTLRELYAAESTF